MAKRSESKRKQRTSPSKKRPKKGRSEIKTETVKISDLRPHPKNYRIHPDRQLEHIQQSLREHGQYRHVVVARDSTILAGHAVVEAARRIGRKEISVLRLACDPDDVLALKVLIGDNALVNMAEIDDRAMTTLLKDISQDGKDLGALLGTGYDADSLIDAVVASRPVEEIRDRDEAAEWLGLPVTKRDRRKTKGVRLIMSFLTRADRARFSRLLKEEGIVAEPIPAEDSRKTIRASWPPDKKPRRTRKKRKTGRKV